MTDSLLHDSSACDQAAGLLGVDQAREKLLDYIDPITEIEYLPIKDALQRIVATPVHSAIAIPPFANSAMDGYAIRHADLQAEQDTVLELVGDSFAGAPYTGRVRTGECVRIMTGAPLPEDCDTVIMQEQVQRDGRRIRIPGRACAGQNVRLPGEDIEPGTEVLQPGKQLQAADLGVLASIGQAEVGVYRRIRVAFFSTGDELCSVGTPLAFGQIYDSNRYLLQGMLTQPAIDAIDMGVIPDQREAVEQAFTDAARISDVVITSGGVSVGEADYVKDTLEKIGEVNFWKVAMKPGKPMAIGRIGDCYFLGLPGNPVSTMATFYQFALPALKKLTGQTRTQPLIVSARCLQALKKTPGRAEFQRGLLTRNDDGVLEVAAAGVQGSHILTSMSKANCFILLSAESAGVDAGDQVDVQPFYGLF